MKLLYTFPLVYAALGAALASPPATAQEPPQELKMIAHQAVEGDAGAQLLYGLAYLEGRYHLQPDAKKAAYWLLRAARDGQPYAQMEMGKLYAAGTGVDKDPGHAVYWWRKAARAGNPEAQYRLGKARLEGFGVDKNPARAVHWLTKAGENGNADAQYLLGKMYHDGYAVAQDNELARDWLSRAAARGHSDAINLLAVVNDVLKYTTMVYQQSADVLKQKAAEGDPLAQYELGLRYESGAWDVTKDNKKALHWLSEAAKNGNRHAMAALAHIYARGELGVKRDPQKAKYWQEKSRLK
jgi:TPR repeat protein